MAKRARATSTAEEVLQFIADRGDSDSDTDFYEEPEYVEESSDDEYDIESNMTDSIGMEIEDDPDDIQAPAAADRHCGSYAFLRKSVKWWRKMLFWLFEVAVVNSYNFDRERRGGGLNKKRHKEFRKKLILQLVGDTRRAARRGRSSSLDSEERLDGKQHFITKNENGNSKDCAVCSNRKTQNKACQRISSLTVEKKGYLSIKFEDACAENLLRMPSLTWQYFASESGITSLYPAVKVDDCDSYDARFRPFYVQSNVPEPKDVVVVIDKSGSMENAFAGKTLMTIAKDAAKTVVSTLNPHDRVAVIGFSDSITSIGSTNRREKCFSEQLAQATSENVETISQFIDEISERGGTHYGMALNKAFDYFENTPVFEQRDRVILFLSDGQPKDLSNTQNTGNHIFTILKDRNSRANNSVILMTYGLGDVDFSILQHMAEQDGNSYGVENPQQESIKAGLFTHVSNPSELRKEMGSYYAFFSKRTTEPIWSLPYVDKWGLGLLLSVTLPVYDKAGNLAGVAGTDLILDDFLSGAVYFRPSELSYIFIIDEHGFVIYHPYFKYPDDNEVKYIDISAFETNPNMQSVIEDMKRGGKGTTAFQSERVIAGGASKIYGVNTFKVTTEVFWKQIPHSTFSVCVVLAKDDVDATLPELDPRGEDDFLYHRFDLVPPENPCNHYNNYCAKNQSVVSLGPRAFVNPDGYLNDKESPARINTIKNYMMTGRGGSLIKAAIRNSVWATQEAERFWRIHAESELEKYVMWRYVGTKEGVMRMYPGTQLPKDFDPVARPWYINALAHKGRVTFTLPYKDAASGSEIISISKVIFGGKMDGIHNTFKDEVHAVAAVDLTVPFFNEILSQSFPICFKGEMGNSQCTLIDSAGFVMFGNTLEHYSAFPDHITEIEPRIAKSLIENNIMEHSECLIMEETTVQRTYKIIGSEWFVGTTDFECETYQFVPIPRTNIYIIVRSSSSSCTHADCTCSKFASASGVRKCSSTLASCECPCTTPYEDYNACVNKFNYTGKMEFPKPCQPSPKPLMTVGESERCIQNLPRCTVITNAPDPVCTTSNGDNIGDNPSNVENIGPIVGGVVGVVLLFLIIVVMVACVMEKQKADPGPPPPPPPHPQDLPLPPIPSFVEIYVNATPVASYI